MKIQDYKGFEFHLPQSGGKAGKNRNLTTSLQVRRNSCIEKQFRFQADSRLGKNLALAKAEAYCDNKLAEENEAVEKGQQ